VQNIKKIKQIIFFSIPMCIAMLFFAAAVAAHMDDIRPWLSPLAVIGPILMAAVLCVCTIFSLTGRKQMWWKLAATGSFGYLLLSAYSLSALIGTSFLGFFEVASYLLLGVLLFVSVMCIRALSLNPLAPNKRFYRTPGSLAAGKPRETDAGAG
jgi:hypothetical protein